MNQKDKEFFDNIASKWDTMTTVSAEKINHILDLSKIQSGDSVLDVGTGTGVLIPFITERLNGNGKIDAVDISEGMLAEARKKYFNLCNVNFKLLDIESETLSEQYDRIMLYCMYPHLVNGEDTVEWLAKLNLKEGGTLTIAFPESKESINAIHHHNDGSVHSGHLIEGELFKLRLESRGLKVVELVDNAEYYIVIITK